MLRIPPYFANVRTSVRAGALALALAIAHLIAAGSDAGAQAATYFVDNQSGTCSAVGPGTEAQPYCSITAAVAARKGPGVTIVVKPGIYREQITVSSSGTAEAPYVIQAEGPGVVIEGADDFTNEGLWVQPAAAAVPGDHAPQAVDFGWLAQNVTWSPQQVFVDGRRLTRSTADPQLLPADAFTWVQGEGLYVNLAGENPGRHVVMVGRRSHAFRMSDKAWVRIEGFEINRVDDTAIGLYTNCADVTIARNVIRLSESYGIKAVASQRITIEKNSVSDNHYHGIGLTSGSTGCVVKDNDSFGNAEPGARTAKGIYLQFAPNNIIAGNRTYENQDTGVQVNAGSHFNLLYNNRSWNNGDHGFDHLDASGTIHVHNVAFGNLRDGFSVEGTSPNTQVFNSIAFDNGLTTGRFNLWVNPASAVGFTSDYNIFWNSTGQEPIKFVATKYFLLSDYQAATGQDMHSIQADPVLADPRGGDFIPLAGSPAIDAGNSSVPNWPAVDEAGNSRVDDPGTPDHGFGPVTFADIGSVEYLPPSLDTPVQLVSPRQPIGDHAGADPIGPGATLALSTGFPNPSSGPVEFSLDLARPANVEWVVYDLQGRTVWSEGRALSAGRTQLRWDGVASTGEPAATGIYLVRARIDDVQLTRRVIRF